MSERPIRRVLMTGDTVGGVWTFTLELARALQPHGVEVMLAAMGGEPNPAQRACAAEIGNLRLVTSSFKLEWMENPWHDVEASGDWVLALEREYAPDVVHLNTYGHCMLPFRAPTLLTAHSCVLSWWSAVRGPEPLPMSWCRYRGEVECALRAVDMLTAPSKTMLRMVGEAYGTELPPCRVIPNGRDASRFRPATKEPYVLAAGRLWDEAKNIGAVARAARRLEWPVYVAGEACDHAGQSRDFLGCRVLGWLGESELAGWYGRASVYALPARYEPFGLSALEAALSGCALVLGDIPSLREIWGNDAVFVDPCAEDALAQALAALISDAPRREDLARRGMERARQFTPERTAQEYLNAYQWLATTRRVACAS